MAKKEKKIVTKKEKTVEVVSSNNVKDKTIAAKTAVKKNGKNKKVKTAKTKNSASQNKTIKTKDSDIKKAKAPKTEILKQDPLMVVSSFLGSIKTKHLPEILHDLMTEKEVKEFAERIEILKQLQNGVTQRVIAKNLGISVTTVSRGSKVLQTGKQRIKKYL